MASSSISPFMEMGVKGQPFIEMADTFI